MAPDDLNAPLGQDTGKTHWKPPAMLPHIVAGVLGLFTLAVAGWAIFADDPLGGEPYAVVATKAAGPAKSAASEGASDSLHHTHHDGLAGKGAANDAAAAITVTTPPPGSKTVTIIDGSSGNTRDVVIPGSTAAVAPVTPAAPKTPAVPNMTEQTRHGAIPIIGPHGERASVVFAHPRHLAADKAREPASPSLSPGSVSAPPAPPTP